MQELVEIPAVQAVTKVVAVAPVDTLGQAALVTGQAALVQPDQAVAVAAAAKILLR
jgi:hypothetical protein